MKCDGEGSRLNSGETVGRSKFVCRRKEARQIDNMLKIDLPVTILEQESTSEDISLCFEISRNL
jgi:hypothetical protein